MIVVISYYRDRTDEPEIRFIPKNGTQAAEVGKYMASLANQSKIIKIYQIFDLGSMPDLVHPNQTNNNQE